MKYRGTFFSLPNVIFLLGQSPSELAVYCYLRRCENQKTHQCWPSYKTIGEAVHMNEYMRALHQRFYREPDLSELEKDIENTRQEVRDCLDKLQRCRLMHLVDTKNLLREETERVCRQTREEDWKYGKAQAIQRRHGVQAGG